MGSSAEKAWAAILKDMQHILQHSGAAQGPVAAGATAEGAMTNVNVQLMRLIVQPPLPHATWKKLIANMKVLTYMRSCIQWLVDSTQYHLVAMWLLSESDQHALHMYQLTADLHAMLAAPMCVHI